MGLGEREYRIGQGLEAAVKEIYERGIEVIRRESEDPIRCLDELDSIFKALRGSRPGSDKIEWARDLIRAYRNLGRIIPTLLPEQSLTYSTQLSRILSKYEEVLGEFSEEGTPEALDEALSYLAEVGKVLGGYELDEALKYLAEVRDILKEYGDDADAFDLTGELRNLKGYREVLADWDIEDPSDLKTILEERDTLGTRIKELEDGLSEF